MYCAVRVQKIHRVGLTDLCTNRFGNGSAFMGQNLKSYLKLFLTSVSCFRYITDCIMHYIIRPLNKDFLFIITKLTLSSRYLQ